MATARQNKPQATRPGNQQPRTRERFGNDVVDVLESSSGDSDWEDVSRFAQEHGIDNFNDW